MNEGWITAELGYLREENQINYMTGISERSAEDANASMGVGATDSQARVLAAVGELSEAPTNFLPCDDVHCAGVLMAIPALVSCGLFKYSSRFFSLPKGYYGVRHIFMLLAFMALCRIKLIEGLASCSLGEWGKLLGLDRSPATKTLRKKIELL